MKNSSFFTRYQLLERTGSGKKKYQNVLCMVAVQPDYPSALALVYRGCVMAVYTLPAASSNDDKVVHWKIELPVDFTTSLTNERLKAMVQKAVVTSAGDSSAFMEQLKDLLEKAAIRFARDAAAAEMAPPAADEQQQPVGDGKKEDEQSTGQPVAATQPVETGG